MPKFLTEGSRSFLYNKSYVTGLLEKRGPVEKGPKGWPINPYGVVALVIFVLIIAILIVRPIAQRKLQKSPFVSGKLISPKAGELVKGPNLLIELELDNPSKVAKVQFWAKTYSENKWEIISEDTAFPFELDWQIPPSYRNKSVAITTNVFGKNGEIAKDPGGWREGIIILSP